MKVVELNNEHSKQFDPSGRWEDVPHAKQRLYHYILPEGLDFGCLFVSSVVCHFRFSVIIGKNYFY